jgi:hypothetical protein
MSLVVDELLEENQLETRQLVAFFFCDKTSRNEQLVGPRSILRNLLKQLLSSMSGGIPEEICQLYESKRREGIIKSQGTYFHREYYCVYLENNHCD